MTIIVVAGIAATMTETAMTHAAGVVMKIETMTLADVAKIETLAVIGVTIVGAAAKIQ